MDTEIVTNAEEAVAPAEAAVETVKPARAPMNRGKRRKVCQFCADKIEHIDYKDIKRLSKCVSERSKILPRRVTGTCAKHQRQVTVAVKRARTVALLAYISD
jgi:small subunit ribosomal protein S18